MHSCRKHKACDVGDLSQCLCGETVSVAQIDISTDVAQYKKAGCETGQVKTRFFTDLHIEY
jgi:hypothetical protein